MSGKTDPQIVREILELAGMGPDTIEGVLPAALAEAERTLALDEPVMLAEGGVHPGVVDLLTALGAVEGVRQTLLTGNLAPNAAVKVRTFGLDAHFDAEIGAYGSDHADRECLVPVALERARARRGEHYALDEVWVIGDTPHDLRCARAAGVRCLIVGTGAGGPDAARALDADAVLDDLADTKVALEILLGP